MIKKIAGKFHTHAINHLSKNNNKITNKKDIADELAITFSKNSSAKHGNEKFAKFKQKAEKLKLNFKSNNTESYNLPFTIEELKDAIQTSHNTAIGPDEIHYEFLKHLPKKSLDYLLTIVGGRTPGTKLLLILTPPLVRGNSLLEVIHHHY